MPSRRMTFKARAAAAATFDATAPQTPLHKANNPHRLDLIFQTLSNRNRRLMLSTLSDGPSCVSELAGLAAASWPAGVKQVRLLEVSGLIHTEKVGRTRMCYLNAEAMALAENWLHTCSGDRRRSRDGRT
jgi:DNA-binding transcriptional ArsR family regulator